MKINGIRPKNKQIPGNKLQPNPLQQPNFHPHINTCHNLITNNKTQSMIFKQHKQHPLKFTIKPRLYNRIKHNLSGYLHGFRVQETI